MICAEVFFLSLMSLLEIKKQIKTKERSIFFNKEKNNMSEQKTKKN
jgi:hypothetical protein